MSLQADIQWIKAELDSLKDPSLIEAFKKILQYSKRKENSDWWDTISNKEKELIEIGTTQLKNGEGIPHKEVRKKAERVLRKK